MATIVNVLCPNGRRENIKVSSNTKLLQVLEDICKKHGFLSEKYELRHGRNLLDLTIPFRYANLPNNAKLEMVKSDKPRCEFNVIVAIQLENGHRIQNEFSPVATLWDILTTVESQNAEFRNNIACTKTSPNSQEVKLHPVCIYMREEIIGENALRSMTLRGLGLTGGSTVIRLMHRQVSDEVLGEIDARLEQDKVKRQRRDRKSHQSPAATNFQSPEESRFMTGYRQEVAQSSSVDNQSVDRSVVDGNIAVVVPSSSVFDVTDQCCSQTRIPVHQTTPKKPIHNFVSPFADFRFPADTEGKHVYKNELSEVNTEEYIPCERKPLYYRLDDRKMETSTEQSTDLPDEFFEVTEQDLRKMMNDLQNKVLLLNEQPLTTQSIKLQRLEEQISKYKYTVIRCQFPDRTILQGIFRPRETVRNLYKFVAEYLVDKSIPFYLYSSPPKVEFKDESQLLYHVNLVPAAYIYFGSTVHKDHYLNVNLLQLVASAADAKQEAMAFFPTATSDDSETSTAYGFATSSQPGVKAAKSTDKLPKWFKTVKK